MRRRATSTVALIALLLTAGSAAASNGIQSPARLAELARLDAQVRYVGHRLWPAGT